VLSGGSVVNAAGQITHQPRRLHDRECVLPATALARCQAFVRGNVATRVTMVPTRVNFSIRLKLKASGQPIRAATATARSLDVSFWQRRLPGRLA